MPRALAADRGILVSCICKVNSVSCSWAVFDVRVAARAALGVVPPGLCTAWCAPVATDAQTTKPGTGREAFTSTARTLKDPTQEAPQSPSCT